MSQTTEDYGEWSAWKVWWHPHRAFEMINNLMIMEVTLQSELEEVRQALEEQKHETARYSSQVTSLTSELEAEREEATRLRRKLEAAESELSDQNEMAQLIEEFERNMTQIEKMKRDYERKIADLESRLGHLNVQLNRISANELLEPSAEVGELLRDGRRRHKFGLPLRDAGPESEGSEPPQKMKSDDDWLMELPDI